MTPKRPNTFCKMPSMEILFSKYKKLQIVNEYNEDIFIMLEIFICFSYIWKTTTMFEAISKLWIQTMSYDNIQKLFAWLIQSIYFRRSIEKAKWTSCMYKVHRKLFSLNRNIYIIVIQYWVPCLNVQHTSEFFSFIHFTYISFYFIYFYMIYCIFVLCYYKPNSRLLISFQVIVRC